MPSPVFCQLREPQNFHASSIQYNTPPDLPASAVSNDIRHPSRPSFIFLYSASALTNLPSTTRHKIRRAHVSTPRPPTHPHAPGFTRQRRVKRHQTPVAPIVHLFVFSIGLDQLAVTHAPQEETSSFFFLEQKHTLGYVEVLVIPFEKILPKPNHRSPIAGNPRLNFHRETGDYGPDAIPQLVNQLLHRQQSLAATRLARQE